MKGWFFHHHSRLHRHARPRWSHPGYNAGWWCRPDEAFEVMGSDHVRILPLPKGRWLGRFHPVAGDPPLHWSRVEAVLADHFGRTRRALMCAQSSSRATAAGRALPRLRRPPGLAGPQALTPAIKSCVYPQKKA